MASFYLRMKLLPVKLRLKHCELKVKRIVKPSFESVTHHLKWDNDILPEPIIQPFGVNDG